MGKIKTTSIRIVEETEKFLTDNFDTAGGGVSQCVNIVKEASKNGIDVHSIVENVQAFEHIRLYSTRELKGKFSASEWKYFADSLNGTKVTPEFRASTSALIASIEDSNDFDNLGEKWDVNIEEFCNKVKTLTGAQVDAVYARVEKFWDQVGLGNAKEGSDWDIDNWAKW